MVLRLIDEIHFDYSCLVGKRPLQFFTKINIFLQRARAEKRMRVLALAEDK